MIARLWAMLRPLAPLAPFASFSLIGVLVYRRALRGGLITDDWLYLTLNPYVHRLSWENLLAILDPWGLPALDVANYAPVHLLGHALEWQAFGTAAVPYHLVNVGLHALNASLLVALLRRGHVPLVSALIAGLLFLVHPANVEAVAWISQLKTCGALALSLGALLALRRRPGVATLLFLLGMLSKPSALATLPAAAAFAWAWQDGSPGAVRRWRWLGVWVVLVAAYMLPQLTALSYSAFEAPPSDIWTVLRTSAAIGLRYLLMAASGYGVAAFQEPQSVRSWLDPYWLVAVPVGALLAWRLLYALRRRRLEAGYWLFAAAAFGPISQVIPFYFGMADRYLYFVLPGLLGGGLLWWYERDADAPAAVDRVRVPAAARATAACALVLAGYFAQVSALRAGLWRDYHLLVADAARHDPGSSSKLVVDACRAARDGDAEGAVRGLREMVQRGYVGGFQNDPCFKGILETTEFREFMQFMAAHQLEKEYARERSFRTPHTLAAMANYHAVLGEYEQAEELLSRAIRQGGPMAERLMPELLRIGSLRSSPPPAPPGPEH